MKRLTWVLERIVDSLGYVCAGLVILMIGLILVEVFFRFVLNDPLMVSDEFSAYMLVAVAFLGTAYGCKTRVHVRITFLVARLPQKTRNWVNMVTLILSFAMMAALSHAGYLFVTASFRYGLRSGSYWRTPLQGIHAIIAIGIVVAAIWLLVEIYRAAMRLRGTELMEEPDVPEEGI